MLLNIILLVVGFILLIKGADVFVEGASKVAAMLHIPQIVIGLTIVAFGTSAPEAAVSIASAYKGTAGIAIGNIIGSNIANVLLILGISGMIGVLAVKKSTFFIETPFVIVITIALLFLGYPDGSITKVDGGILWMFFLLFLFYLYRLFWRVYRSELSNPKKIKKGLRPFSLYTGRSEKPWVYSFLSSED